MKTLIVITGARGAGKSYTASRLAEHMPGAVVIDEHEWGMQESDRRYDRRRHIWSRPDEADWLTQGQKNQVVSAAAVILCSAKNTEAKVMSLQQVSPCCVVFCGVFRPESAYATS